MILLTFPLKTNRQIFIAIKNLPKLSHNEIELLDHFLWFGCLSEFYCFDHALVELPAQAMCGLYLNIRISQADHIC